MKYIVLETDEGQKLPIIFPEAFVHAEVADLMKRLCMISLNAKGVKVASAGFVGFRTMPLVSGESESLGGLQHNRLDGVRMMAGASVAHMPDFIIQRLAGKIIDLEGSEPS